MNKDIIITSSGNVVVLDENHKPREVENSNNLEERLIQENIIETIENRIKELEEDLAECSPPEEINQKKFIPLFTILSMAVCLVWPIVDCLIRGDFAILASTHNTFFSIYKDLLFSSLSTYIVTALLGVCFDAASFIKNKEFKANFNADVAELETLRRILPEEKEQLKKLNSEQKVLPQKNHPKYSYDISIKQINDQKYLNELNDYLEVYRAVGIELPKLYEAYLNNTLESFLKENGYEFSKEEYEILLNYIKEKGPSVVSNKKMKKRRKKL